MNRGSSCRCWASPGRHRGIGRCPLPPGEYQLIVESAGFAALHKSLSIGASNLDLTLQLALAAERETITVTAPAAYTASDSVTAAKVDIPIMETPIAVAVVPAQDLADQQTVKLIDALTNVSGVAPTNDGYGTSDIQSMTSVSPTQLRSAVRFWTEATFRT